MILVWLFYVYIVCLIVIVVDCNIGEEICVK